MNKLLLSMGIDTETATVDLTGEVDDVMYKKVLKAIHILKDADYITFVLNTPGGSFYQGLAIYDLIRLGAPNSKIICCGMVMSAGVIILTAGSTRVSYPSTQFLVHYGEDSNTSTTEANHNAKMLRLMKDILCTKVNVKRRTVNSWFTKETYYDVKGALEVGLIDRVVEDD